MTNPFTSLSSCGYAQEEIKAIIAKYPNVNTHAANMSSGYPDQNATVITDSIAAEFEVIFKKLLDCVKEEMKGSPECNPARDQLGNTYASVIDRDYHDGIQPAPHGGWPGATWAWETSIAGQVCKKINALYGICAKANTYRLQKEEQKKKRDAQEIVWAKEREIAEAKAKEDKEIFNEYFPILQKSIVFTRYNKGKISADNIYVEHSAFSYELLTVGKFYMVFQFNLETIKEIEEKIGFNSVIALTERAIKECSDIIREFCKKELHKQKIDEEVERRLQGEEQRLAEEKFDQEVEAEIKRRADKKKFDEEVEAEMKRILLNKIEI